MTILSNISNITPGLLEKLTSLYRILMEGKADYEQMGADFSDKQLKNTVLSLAQESNQYAAEVSSQIHCLAGDFKEPLLKYNLIETDGPGSSDEERISKVCDISEDKLLRFYKELLDEPNMFSLFKGLRRMIQYQMERISGDISQLRLLQTSLHK
jgi:hypothetical protein